MPKKISQTPSKIDELTFQLIENSVVILSKNGAYAQYEAYTRRGEVFAKVGNYFVGLRRHGTSMSGYNIVDFDLGGQEEYAYTDTGRLVLIAHPDASQPCSRVRLEKPLSSGESKHV